VEGPAGRPTSWGGAISSAFLTVLARPQWWLIALASFLLRGGILAVILPIVTLPTVASLSGLASPTLSAIVSGNPPASLVTSYVLLGGAIATWVVVALIVGGWLETELVGDLAGDEELGLAGPSRKVALRHAIGVRLIAHVGTLVVASYAVVRLVVEGYSEIFSPGDASVPLAWRIALRALDAIVVLGGAWLVGESLAGLAVRRLAVGDSLLAALARGVRLLLRPSGLATLALTNAGIGLALLALWLAGSTAWDQARVLLVDEAPAPLLIAGLLLFVTTWLLGLALLGASLAWRTAAWAAGADQAMIPGRSSTVATDLAHS